MALLERLGDQSENNADGDHRVGYYSERGSVRFGSVRFMAGAEDASLRNAT